MAAWKQAEAHASHSYAVACSARQGGCMHAQSFLKCKNLNQLTFEQALRPVAPKDREANGAARGRAVALLAVLQRVPTAALAPLKRAAG